MAARAASIGRAIRLALLGGCALGAGCEREVEAPVWLALARGFRPASVQALNAAWARAEPPLAVRADGDGVWVEYELDSWRRVEARSQGGHEEWWTERPETASPQHKKGGRVELRLDGRVIRQCERRNAGKAEEAEPADEHFLLEGRRVSLRRPAGAGAPPVGVLSSWLERGHEQDGVWRATVETLAGDGLTLWPGERCELVHDVPPASALRLVTASRSLGRAGKLRFRVLLDGEVLLEHEQASEHETGVAHVLALPSAGRAAARLVFEVRGPPAVSAFLEPVIGPAEVGTHGARPWATARPDLVVFLADTFRADNLAAYGGARELCPALNRLGEQSVRFLQARSASVWTLPSHGAMFTGLYPPQHGALERHLTFSSELVTLAEHLAASGYRTGAVTDSAFVSRHYGLDEGFGWFQEQDFEQRRLKNTLAWADEFLERDDGRPVFLFVHTYRTHTPYRQGPEESEEELLAFMREVRSARRAAGTDEHEDRFHGAFAPRYLALYRGCARALDAGFGPWFEGLERRGLFRHGYFVFTSDHGEAFFEHGSREHSGRPHEEKVRIPLFLYGPDLTPRDVSFGAHHIDLAPTLGALAGLAPAPGWVGVPLLELDHERVLFSYNQDSSGAYLATIEGDRKLLETATAGARPRGSFDEVYALATDPTEQENLAAQGPDWAQDLATRSAAQLDEFFTRIREPAAVDLPDDLRADLEALGYGE